MKTTKSPFIVKVSYDDRPNKIYFNRKQSLQMDQGSRQSLDKQIKENYLSSYPIFEVTKSKIISPPMNEQNCEQYDFERKKSSFLKNYNEKLKRERKRQLKLKSSIKQLKISRNPVNQNRTINCIDEMPQNQINSKASTILNEHDKRSTSILVLIKTPFLDTSSSIFRQRKDYSKDSSLQLLLKEIHEIRIEEKREIQKLNQQRKMLEQDSYNKKVNNGTMANFFTRYERGFLLPMRRKLNLQNGKMSKTSDLYENLQNSLSKYGSKEKIVSLKKITDKGRMQKFYNFKQIDPWQNPTQREQNNSFDSNFLFTTVQH